MSVAWVSYIDPSGKRERYKAEFESSDELGIAITFKFNPATSGRGEMDLSMARHHRRG
jgi:hypothetical protein